MILEIVVLPWSWSGSITLPGKVAGAFDSKDVLTDIERALAREDPASVDRSENKLEFTAGPLRFTSRFNVLVPIDRGVIRCVEAGGALLVRYEISFRVLFWVVTSILVVLFLMTTVVMQQEKPAHAALAFGVGWLWLFGGNVAIALFRFPALLRRAVARF